MCRSLEVGVDGKCTAELHTKGKTLDELLYRPRNDFQFLLRAAVKPQRRPHEVNEAWIGQRSFLITALEATRKQPQEEAARHKKCWFCGSNEPGLVSACQCTGEFEWAHENCLRSYTSATAVSYTHLTLPTICSV